MSKALLRGSAVNLIHQHNLVPAHLIAPDVFPDERIWVACQYTAGANFKDMWARFGYGLDDLTTADLLDFIRQAQTGENVTLP